MTESQIISDIGCLWKADPTRMGLGTARTGISAALWEFKQDKPFEVDGSTFPDTHILSFGCSGRHRSTYFGDGRLRYSKSVEPWHFNIVPAGEKPRAVVQPEDKVSYFHIYLPVHIIAGALPHAAEGSSAHVEVIDPCSTRDLLVERIGREVFAEMRDEQPLSRLRMDLLGQDLAIQLLRRHSNVAGTRALAREPARGGLAPWQVRRTTEFLAENLAEEVGLETLAGVAQLSTFHFARAFKRSTGVPPHRYQLRLRLERAQALLTGTDLPVTEIAAMVGYDAPQTLARLFRRELGVSPTEYRRQHRM